MSKRAQLSSNGRTRVRRANNVNSALVAAARMHLTMHFALGCGVSPSLTRTQTHFAYVGSSVRKYCSVPKKCPQHDFGVLQCVFYVRGWCWCAGDSCPPHPPTPKRSVRAVSSRQRSRRGRTTFVRFRGATVHAMHADPNIRRDSRKATGASALWCGVL